VQLSKEERIGEAQRILKNWVQIGTLYGNRGNPKRIKLAMFTAYFDETGTGKNEELCVVSGFYGDEGQWNAFIKNWLDVRGANTPPLHLRTLRWNGRHYASIEKNLAKLGPIPHKYNLTPVAISMYHSDYQAFMKGKVREEMANPYMLCAQACIKTTLEHIGPKDEVMFIFDRQEGRRRMAMEKLRTIVFQWAGMDHRVKDIDFKNTASTPCLEIADFLSFAVREYKMNKNSLKAKATVPILLAKRGYGATHSTEQVRDLAAHFISNGMVPGGGRIKISREIIDAMIKARLRKLES